MAARQARPAVGCSRSSPSSSSLFFQFATFGATWAARGFIALAFWSFVALALLMAVRRPS
jgi:hypothetical protein